MPAAHGGVVSCQCDEMVAVSAAVVKKTAEATMERAERCGTPQSRWPDVHPFARRVPAPTRSAAMMCRWVGTAGAGGGRRCGRWWEVRVVARSIPVRRGRLCREGEVRVLPRVEEAPSGWPVVRRRVVVDWRRRRAPMVVSTGVNIVACGGVGGWVLV